jgi:hypothetical protein
MPGIYETSGVTPAKHATLLTALQGWGPPIRLPSIAQFQYVPMYEQCAGPIVGTPVSGLWTAKRNDCIVVAAMMHDGLGNWISYYFAHLAGGRWTAKEQALFNAVITYPAHTFIVMNCSGFAATETLLEDINAGNPNGNIRRKHLLKYRSPNPTFALRLRDAAIGEIP